MDTVFRFSNFLVLPFWALMILLPRWRWTERIVRSPLVSLAPAALYATLVLDSRERQISAWFTVPLLFLTLMLGPAGFLLYLAVRVVAPAPRAAEEPVRSAA